MREYEYNMIKQVDRLDNIMDRITINGVTLHHIDVLTFKEYHRDYIVMGLHYQDEEIASVTIRQNEKLVIDENSNSYTVTPV